MQCSNNATAMQCNAMQCMYGSPSVRTDRVRSVFFFSFFFSICAGGPSVCTEHEIICWIDRQVSFIFVSMYECADGQTSCYFRFSFSSVAYSQVSLSVRTEVPTKKKEKKNIQTEQTQTHRSDQVYTNGKKNLLLNLFKRDRWHNSKQTCRTINITFSQYAMQCNAMQCNAMQCNAIQYNAMQCNTMQYNTMQCMYGIRPSDEWSQSVIFLFFFIFFFIVRKSAEVRRVCTEHECLDGQTNSVLWYVRMSGRTGFGGVISVQFQFSRIQSSSLSVRTEVQQKKAEQTQTHRSDRVIH
jgi:hypothetical protein